MACLTGPAIDGRSFVAAVDAEFGKTKPYSTGMEPGLVKDFVEFIPRSGMFGASINDDVVDKPAA